MHKLLERQLKRFHAGATQQPGDWQAFLAAIGEAYRQSDHDRLLLERSLELTSQELLARNEELRDEHVSERRALEEQLRQSQKLEAVGLLAGGVAHDFNNLLTVIFACCDELLEHVGHHDPRREGLQEIRRAGERAAGLTRQLLAFSRRQVLQPQVLLLNTVVENLQTMLRRLLRENIRFELHLDPALSSIRADVGQLEQVLVNLIVNARDAMPQGGHLHIETRNFLVDEVYARRHPGVTHGPHVLLAVTDSGLGMDADTQQRIFEPFFTTKGPGQGTGLGLSTVYGIVQQSGGFIWVYSEAQRGTTFKVYLPAVSAADVAHAADPSPETPRLALGHETVLLVEDEPTLRWVIRSALERQGHRVIEATGGDAAEQLLRDLSVPIDLLLTDIVLPGPSGTAIAHTGLALRPDLRVLYMSGYTADAMILRGELPRGSAFLEKPFSPATLLTRVRAMLEGPAPDWTAAATPR